MKSLALTLIVALGLTGFALAAVDPTVPTPTLEGVVAQCQVAAKVAADGTKSFDGMCVDSTRQYLDALRALDPALDEATFNQDITDLVLALVPLAEDDVCNGLDEEIARAIRLASGYSTSPDQTTQLVQISDTVAACDSGSTGTISSQPASPNA